MNYEHERPIFDEFDSLRAEEVQHVATLATLNMLQEIEILPENMDREFLEITLSANDPSEVGLQNLEPEIFNLILRIHYLRTSLSTFIIFHGFQTEGQDMTGVKAFKASLGGVLHHCPDDDIEEWVCAFEKLYKMREGTVTAQHMAEGSMLFDMGY
jgi:hypothetical protein